jgi:DNA-binding transcriptional LysR family regulator
LAISDPKRSGVARERLITYTAADYPEYRAWLAGLFAPLKLAPRIAEEYDSATSVIASAEAGRGVALCHKTSLGWPAEV